MNTELDFEYITGARKGSVLVYLKNENQIFAFKSKYFNKKTNEHIKRYECYQSKCKASILISEVSGKCTVRPGKEVHLEHGDQEEHKKQLVLKNKIKTEVAQPSLQANRVREVFNNECHNNKDTAKSLVFSKMQRHLRRIKCEKMPKAPQSPQDFIKLFKNSTILNEFGMCESNDKEKFYQTTVTEDDFSYTLFLSTPITKLINDNINCDDRHYLMDATFAVVPACGYKQLLIIHIAQDRHVSKVYKLKLSE